MENNINNHNDDIISLTEIMQVLVKRIKLFLVILIIGIVLSIAAFFYKNNNYTYTYYLQAPEYLAATNNYLTYEHKLLVDYSTLTDYLNYYLIDFKNQNPAQKEPLTKNIILNSNNSSFILLQLNGHKTNKNIIKVVLNDYIQFANKMLANDLIEKKRYLLQLTKKDLIRKYADMQNLMNIFNQNNLKENLDTDTSINTKSQYAQMNLATDEYSALVDKHFQLSLDIINIKNQINYTDAALNSIQGIVVKSKLLQSKKPVGLNKNLILLLGIITSIIFSLIIVFIIEFLSKLKTER